jgi:hypothetical protein
LVYTIDVPNSNIQSTLTAEFDITVNADLWVPFFGWVNSDWNGDGRINSERLDSNAVGTMTADFGLPGWDNAAHFLETEFVTPDPGDAYGSYSVEIGPCNSVFDFSVSLDEISVVLAQDVYADPLDPSQSIPGAGPWTATDYAWLYVSALGGAHVTGNGLLSWIGFDLQDFIFGAPALPVPISMELARTFDQGTEVGHEITIGLENLALAFQPVDVERFFVDDCAYFDTADPLVCLVYMNHMDIQLVDYSMTITDIDGQIVARSDEVIPAPQPSSLVLVAIGLAGVSTLRSRARRR